MTQNMWRYLWQAVLMVLVILLRQIGFWRFYVVACFLAVKQLVVHMDNPVFQVDVLSCQSA